MIPELRHSRGVDNDGGGQFAPAYAAMRAIGIAGHSGFAPGISALGALVGAPLPRDCATTLCKDISQDMPGAARVNETLEIDPIDALLGAEDVAPVRLGEAVIEKLTRAILDGRLKPGDALPSEGRIAASFGVSKQVAREAIRELAAMGVVHIQQGKVTRVRDLDAEPLGRFFRFAVRGSATGLSEAVELRRILEPPTARLAAPARSPAEIADLAAILRRMEQSLGDVPSWIEADLDFHEAIGAMSGNRLLRFQIRALRPIISEIMEIFNSRGNRGPADWRETYDRHVRIFKAIETKDADAAFTAMSQHFEAADAAVKELFSGE